MVLRHHGMIFRDIATLLTHSWPTMSRIFSTNCGSVPVEPDELIATVASLVGRLGSVMTP